MSPAPSGPAETIGILGAGKSGVAVARRALAAGYRVLLATSRPAARTAFVTRILAPGAGAADAAGLLDQADVVLLAVPLRRWRQLPLDRLAGKVVVDLMNYWPPADGDLPEFEDANRSSSEVVRDGLPPTARLVKTLNHIGYHEIEELARPAGAPDRVALAVAGDDPDAVAEVARLVDDLGFDPVVLDTLAAGAALQPGTAVFGADLDAAALRAALTRSPQPTTTVAR